MTSSLKLWVPLSLALGWALGVGTERVSGFPPSAPDGSLRALEQLDARLSAIPGQVAALQAQTRCATSAAGEGLDLAALRAELRGVLREELSMMAAKHEPAKASSEQLVPPESLVVMERGQRLLDDALRARRWGDAQAEELRGLFPGLTAAQQQQLAQKLAVSINRGELVVETTGLPF